MSGEEDYDGWEQRLEERLREARAPSARPGFVRDLRAQFVAGDTESASADPTEAAAAGSDSGSARSGAEDPKVRSRMPGEARKGASVDLKLEQALAREPIAPPARPAFRDELRRRFVSGGLTAPALSPASVPARSPAVRAQRGPRVVARSGGRRWLLPSAGLAAAAALLFALLPRDTPEPASPPVAVEPVQDNLWRLVAFGGEAVPAGETLTVDGVDVATADPVALGEALAHAETLQTGDHRLELAYCDRFVIEVQPNTLVELGQPGPEDARLFVPLGEVFLSTRDGHRGDIVMATPDVEVLLTGTTLGLLSTGDNGSCVCVVEGDVTATVGAVEYEVGSRTTLRIFAEGDPDLHPFPDELEDRHVHERSLADFFERP